MNFGQSKDRRWYLSHSSSCARRGEEKGKGRKVGLSNISVNSFLSLVLITPVSECESNRCGGSRWLLGRRGEVLGGA